MRRRTFLQGVVVSALAVTHARTWAQGTTPPLLGEGKPSRTARKDSGPAGNYASARKLN